jgi:choice-of-anchor A domain-containing protein
LDASGNSNVSGSSTITGTFFMNTAGQSTFSGGSHANGGTVRSSSEDAILHQASLDAISASNTYAGMAATNSSITNINLAGGQSLTINGNAGLNVLHLSDVLMSGGSTITLNGPANAAFVLDITGNFNLSGTSQLLLGGGLTANNVLYNILSTGNTVGTAINSGGGSIINGILLAPNREVQIGAGQYFGEIIGGGDQINIHSGEQVFAVVPEVTPASVVIGFLGLLVAVSSRRMLSKRLRPSTVPVSK